MFPASDGNFLFAGMADGKAWLVNITSDGDTIWTKQYGVNSSYFTSIRETARSNYLLVGRKKNLAWVIKIRASGDTLWTRTYKDAGSGFFQWILPITDGQFLLAGSLNHYACLVKIAPDGDKIWIKTYEKGYFNSALHTQDGNYIVAGQASDQNYSRPLVMKINPDGDTIWIQNYMDNSHTMLFVSALDGNFILSGITTNMNTGIRHCWLMSIIDNQYACEKKPFTFTIPAVGSDSLNYVYTPLKTPSDMSVSPGGTISWTPRTDSAYREQVKCLVSGGGGRQDTLTFDIFVNLGNHVPVKTIDNFRSNTISTEPFGIIRTLSSSTIKIYLPSLVPAVYIYDISGKIIDRTAPAISGEGSYALWSGTTSAGGKIPRGEYFTVIMYGENYLVKPFLFIR